MSALVKMRNYKQAKKLYKEWTEPGTASTQLPGVPNAGTYDLYAICMEKLGDPYSEVMHFIETEVQASGTQPTIRMYNSALAAIRHKLDAFKPAVSSSLVEDIVGKIRAIGREPNFVTKRLVAEIYTAHGRYRKASAMFRSMKPHLQDMANLSPASSAWTFLFVALSCNPRQSVAAAVEELAMMRAAEVPVAVRLLARVLEVPPTGAPISRPQVQLAALEAIADVAKHTKRDELPELLEGTLLNCLSLAAQTHHVELAKAAWIMLKKKLAGSGRSPSLASYHCVIHARAGAGDITGALRMVEQLEQDYPHHPEAWAPFPGLSSIVNKCSASTEQVDIAYGSIEDMAARNIPISTGMLNCILAACAQIGDLPRLLETYEAFPKLGLEPNTHTFNMLIMGAAGLRQFDTIEVVRNEMSKTEVPMDKQTYEYLIDGSIKAHDTNKALQTLDAMEKAGFSPSTRTVLNVIKRCHRTPNQDLKHRAKQLLHRFKLSVEESSFNEELSWRNSLPYPRDSRKQEPEPDWV